MKIILLILNYLRKVFLMEKLFIYLPFNFSGDFGYEEVRVFLKDGVHECIYDRVKTNTTVYWPCVVGLSPKPLSVRTLKNTTRARIDSGNYSNQQSIDVYIITRFMLHNIGINIYYQYFYLVKSLNLPIISHKKIIIIFLIR